VTEAEDEVEAEVTSEATEEIDRLAEEVSAKEDLSMMEMVALVV
jgi:hypothetical protein